MDLSKTPFSDSILVSISRDIRYNHTHIGPYKRHVLLFLWLVFLMDSWHTGHLTLNNYQLVNKLTM
jgi:hypothetical protein